MRPRYHQDPRTTNMARFEESRKGQIENKLWWGRVELNHRCLIDLGFTDRVSSRSLASPWWKISDSNGWCSLLSHSRFQNECISALCQSSKLAVTGRVQLPILFQVCPLSRRVGLAHAQRYHGGKRVTRKPHPKVRTDFQSASDPCRIHFP
jgi:hypothetical protein